MRILIHDHPQITYFARIYAELSKSTNEYWLLDGPSFMHSSTKQMHEYIRRAELYSALKANVNFVSYNGKSFDPNLASNLISRSSFFPDLLKILEVSVDDTICRNLIAEFNTLSYIRPCILSRYLMRSERIVRSLGFITYYLSLLDKIKPDIVYMSHGNFDFYTALYIACVLNKIPIRIYHGGYQARYWPSRVVSCLSPMYAIDDVCKKVTDNAFQAINFQVTAGSDSFKSQTLLGDNINKRSALHYLASTSKDSYSQHYRCLLVCFPVLSEVNRRFDCHGHRQLFNNRWETMQYILTNIKPTFENRIIIRFHPLYREKGDASLMEYLLRSILQKSEYLYISEGGKLEDEIKQMNLSISLGNNLDILASGSMPLELACIGYCANVINHTIAPRMAYNKLDSLEDLNALLHNERRFRRIIKEPMIRQKAKSYAKIYGASGYLSDSTGFLEKIDEYYHFGKINTAPNPREVSDLIDKYVSDYSQVVLHGTSFSLSIDKPRKR
jgi:hypothetical protein